MSGGEATDAPEIEGGDVPYVLPRHPGELDRLDVQHFALQRALRANYVAPVASPARVLDVGAGTGQWGHDLCAEFPEASVVGFDLVGGRPGAPGSYREVRGNLLRGLPFADGLFDFVHMRFMFSAVPIDAWQDTVRELLRVCRPGGWVELVEGATWFEPVSPSTERLAQLLRSLNATRGLDSEGVVFASLDGYLSRAGAEEVSRTTVALPLGEWGGRLGSLMAADFRALFTRLAPAFVATLGAAPEDCRDLVQAAEEEWDRYRTTYGVVIAAGRRSA